MFTYHYLYHVVIFCQPWMDLWLNLMLKTIQVFMKTKSIYEERQMVTDSQNRCRIIDKFPDRVKRPRRSLPGHLGDKHLSWLSILIEIYILIAKFWNLLGFLLRPCMVGLIHISSTTPLQVSCTLQAVHIYVHNNYTNTLFFKNKFFLKTFWEEKYRKNKHAFVFCLDLI